jgi:WD40 repeat protein
VLRNHDAHEVPGAVMDPDGHWLVANNVLWPLGSRHARVFRSLSPGGAAVLFTPDGSALVSTSWDGAVRLWPVSSRGGERSRTLMEDETARLVPFIDIDPAGRYALVGTQLDTRVWLVPLEGGEPRRMPTRDVGWQFGRRFSPDGRLAAVAGVRPGVVRIWDLETDEVRVIDTRVPDEEGCTAEEYAGSVDDLIFLTDRRLLTVGAAGVRIWDLERATSEQLRPCIPVSGDGRLAVDRDRRRVLVLGMNSSARGSTLSALDVDTGTFHEITSHGNRVSAVALDPTGTIIVTGDLDGVVRVGPVTGEAPHLLFGHTLEIWSVAVSPDGRWIASESGDGSIRLWPMPEGTPFHTLPYAVILERLRGLTNLRVVPDESSDTGYRVDIGPFPGWRTLPDW